MIESRALTVVSSRAFLYSFWLVLVLLLIFVLRNFTFLNAFKSSPPALLAPEDSDCGCCCGCGCVCACAAAVFDALGAGGGATGTADTGGTGGATGTEEESRDLRGAGGPIFSGGACGTDVDVAVSGGAGGGMAGAAGIAESVACTTTAGAFFGDDDEAAVVNRGDVRLVMFCVFCFFAALLVTRVACCTGLSVDVEGFTDDTDDADEEEADEADADDDREDAARGDFPGLFACLAALWCLSFLLFILRSKTCSSEAHRISKAIIFFSIALMRAVDGVEEEAAEENDEDDDDRTDEDEGADVGGEPGVLPGAVLNIMEGADADVCFHASCAMEASKERGIAANFMDWEEISNMKLAECFRDRHLLRLPRACSSA